MSFIEFLQTIEARRPELVNSMTFVTIKAAASEHNDYRTLSLMMADIPMVSEAFESYWYDYETELDRQVYESKEKKPITDPVNAYDLIRNVIEALRAKVMRHE